MSRTSARPAWCHCSDAASQAHTCAAKGALPTSAAEAIHAPPCARGLCVELQGRGARAPNVALSRRRIQRWSHGWPPQSEPYAPMRGSSSTPTQQLRLFCVWRPVNRRIRSCMGPFYAHAQGGARPPTPSLRTRRRSVLLVTNISPATKAPKAHHSVRVLSPSPARGRSQQRMRLRARSQNARARSSNASCDRAHCPSKAENNAEYDGCASVWGLIGRR